MSITVTEKEHWKERISQRIERAIEELVERTDPTFLDKIAEKAQELAIEALGGKELLSELNQVNEKHKKIAEEIEHLEVSLIAIAKKHLTKEQRSRYYGKDFCMWENVVLTHQRRVENDLLSKEPLGRQILKLRNEQESLLDTVWLSTSTTQIRNLWKNVMELVSGEVSELQKNVLSRPAIKEE